MDSCQNMTPFKTGQVINTCHQPFAYSLLPEERHTRCDFCTKKVASATVTCFKCSCVIYCSRQCSKDGWTMHEKECPVLACRPLSAITRVIGRIMVKVASGQSDSAFDLIFGIKRTWSDLVDHYKEVTHDAAAMMAFNQILPDLELMFGTDLNVTSIISIYGKVLVNSFAIQDELFRPIGRGVYLGPSIFDHSCCPNASFTFSGLTLTIKAIKDISTDEDHFRDDIRISYIDELDLISERRRQLQQNYYFVCDCDRCEGSRYGFDKSTNVDQTLVNLRDELECVGVDSVTILFGHLDPEAAKVTSKLIAHSDLIMALDDVIKIRLAEILATLTSDARLALTCLSLMKRYYGCNHPRIGLQLILTSRIVGEGHLRLKLLTEAMNVGQVICNIAQSGKNFLFIVNMLVKDAESELIGQVSAENKKAISKRLMIAEKSKEVVAKQAAMSRYQSLFFHRSFLQSGRLAFPRFY